MNKQFRHALVVCLAAAASFGVSMQTASAQIMESLKVNLPEAVEVGGVVIPAGDCTIQDIGKDDGSTVLLIHSEAGVNATVIAEPTAPAEVVSSQTKVLLRHLGNRYQLDKIWIAGQGMGYHIVSLAGQE